MNQTHAKNGKRAIQTNRHRTPIQFHKFGPVFITVFAALGIYFLTTSNAQTPYVSNEAESGTLANGAQTVADASASNGNAVKFSGTTQTTLSPTTLISQNQPTYTSGTVVYPVSQMVDATYDEYQCTPTCAGIIHFTSPAVTNTTSGAIVSWYNEENDFWAKVPFLNDPYYNLPKNFTIDGCAASCSGTPPTSGWTNLVTINNNLFNGGQYAVNLGSGCGGSPCTWLRMNVTASNGSTGNTDAAWHMDVTACSSSCTANNDTWLFLGDSITNNSMGHCVGANCPETPGAPSNFMQEVHAGNPSFYPSQIEGGVSFSQACNWTGDTADCPDGQPTGANSMINTVLNSFPAAHYVTLNLGTNDLNGGSLSVYETQMTALVQDVIDAGRVPVVPTVPWANCFSEQNDNPATNGTANYWITHTLYSQFPQLVHGPDLWTYFDTNQSQIGAPSGCPHPTTAGQWAYRQLWANTMLTAVY